MNAVHRGCRLLSVLGIVGFLSACSPRAGAPSGGPSAASVSVPSVGNLTDLPRLVDAQTRSVSPENFTGGKGAGGMATEGNGKAAAADLGQGWKVSPSVTIKAHTTFTMATLSGPGCITHIWMTPTGNWRHEILRFYWDNETDPSVETPVGDFFACGLGKYAPVSSPPVCVNPGSAFNCYWPMPFRGGAKITMENRDDEDMVLYYQVDYSVTQVPTNSANFHAQFHHEDPIHTKGMYTLLDGVRGQGQYVGTYMTYQTHKSGWWGEGEMKFYLDGDGQFPTVCTTGTEDYFCGSYDFEDQVTHHYVPFSTPYAGLVQVIPPEPIYVPGQKFGLYRWHIADPVRFTHDLKVQIQDLGWKENDPANRYEQLQDSISTVSYWYQTLPHTPFPPLPSRNELDGH